MTAPAPAHEFSGPEHRTAPPWVMEEMIEAQRELPGEIAAAAGTRELGDLLSGALRGGESILLTGCGTSEHAAQAAAAVIGSVAPDAVVSARDAFEVALDPPASGLVIALSHEAGSAATLDAAEAAAGAGATTALLTARPERAPAGLRTLVTPRLDRSWCHTVAYTSPLLAVALALGAIGPDVATATIAAELDGRPQRIEDAAALGDSTRLLALGSGVDEISARELALKIEEAVHRPTTPLGVEKALHGHLPAADAHTGVVLLRLDAVAAAARDRRAAAVADAVSVLGSPVVWLRPAAPAPTAAQALLAGAVALQLLTLELAHHAGTNPDLIRRDEELYRRVAEAGRAG